MASMRFRIASRAIAPFGLFSSISGDDGLRGEEVRGGGLRDVGLCDEGLCGGGV
jgi:hypothetical protein